jgi:hypothetical protein
MKILSALLPFILLGNVATSAPLSQASEFEDGTNAHEDGLALASLEKRASCQAILGTSTRPFQVRDLLFLSMELLVSPSEYAKSRAPKNASNMPISSRMASI